MSVTATVFVQYPIQSGLLADNDAPRRHQIEQAEQFNDLLADHIMANVEHITTVLRDGQSREQMESLFAGQEADLRDKVQAMLGPDGVAQYLAYSRNLVSVFSAGEFKEKWESRSK